VRAEDDRTRTERLLRFSRLGSMQRFTFDTLLPRGRSTHAAAQDRYAHVVEAARRFAEEPRGWFVLTGVPGSARHIAAVANRAIERGTPALFLTVADLDRLRASCADDAEVPRAAAGADRTAPLVISMTSTRTPVRHGREVLPGRLASLPRGAADRVHVRPRTWGSTSAGRAPDRPALSQVFTLAGVKSPHNHIGGWRLAAFTFEFPPRRSRCAATTLAGGCLPRGWTWADPGLARLLRPGGRGKTMRDREPATRPGRQRLLRERSGSAR
jgi:hypothetical protein